MVDMDTPYTQRSLPEIQAEIDAYEENMSHDHLPPRYDALVAFRNSPLRCSCNPFAWNRELSRLMCPVHGA